MRGCVCVTCWGGASNKKFYSLKDHLENQYTMGTDQYPATSEALLGMMNNFRVGILPAGMRREDDDGLGFAQGEDRDWHQDDDKEGA